jgi:hypothetical protein
VFLTPRREKEGAGTEKMAVGGFAVDGPGSGFKGKITVSVVITCIVAASSGLIFGYDIGISGTFFFLILQWLFLEGCAVRAYSEFVAPVVVFVASDRFVRPFQRGMNGSYLTNFFYLLFIYFAL